jgi:hypothetical protein
MQKTKKKTIKIKDRDLKPAEDAKGGHKRHQGHGFASLLNEKEGPGAQAPGGGYGIHEVQ